MTHSDHPYAAHGDAAGGDPVSDFRSAAPLFTFDTSMRIRSWNAAAAQATGYPAAEVVGRPCWEVLCFHDEAGGTVCQRNCSFHRLLRERWLVVPPTLLVKTTQGPRRMTVPMLVVEGGEVFAALMLDAGAPLAPVAPVTPGSGAQQDDCPPPELTARQRTVLAMLAEGITARTIATDLRLSELTVRNHIRSILRELSCNSQLTAVARARRLGLV